MRFKKSSITALISAMFLWQERLATECTFDQPTSALSESSPNYYHVVPQGTDDSEFLDVTVTSNNDCDQSALVSKEYHFLCVDDASDSLYCVSSEC